MGGCAAAAGTLRGAPAVVLKGQHGEASRWREGSEAGANWEGGVGPEPETPPGRSPRQPGSRGTRTAPRAAEDSSLNLEQNFELAGMGVGRRRSKLLRAVVNLEPARAPFALELEAAPEG